MRYVVSGPTPDVAEYEVADDAPWDLRPPSGQAGMGVRMVPSGTTPEIIIGHWDDSDTFTPLARVTDDGHVEVLTHGAGVLLTSADGMATKVLRLSNAGAVELVDP